MNKRMLVLGINCFPELTGIGKYTGEMVQWFAENGYETTVVTAPPYYPNWAVQQPYSGAWYRKEQINKNLQVYRCPLYVPSKPSGLKRLLHEMTFFASAFFVVCRLLFQKKYDCIFAVAPPFHLGFLALFYRFFKGGKIIYHIQDLQIDAAKELNMLPERLFPMLFGMERFLLNRVNVVSTISEGMKKKVFAKSQNVVVLFPNWVDTEGFFPVADRDSLKSHWGFEPEDKLVLYSGSIGEKQGLDGIIKVAGKLSDVDHVKFIICGNGPFKERLVQMAGELGLQNVFFLPLQGHDVFNNFLNMADVHLVLQKADASDLVMPSKLTSILSVGGLALVTANPGTTLYEVIFDHQMGVVIAPEDESALEQGILSCFDERNEEKRKNARVYALRYLNRNDILERLVQDL